MTRQARPAKAPARGAVAAAITAKARMWFEDPSLVTAPEKLEWKAPKGVIEIGQIVAIEYLSDKYDGIPTIYRHDAEKPRRLMVSPDGSTFIVDPPFKITARGIEG